MKYLYKFLILLIFFPSLSYAQSNFKPGYIVTLSGDTVRGFIDYKEWDQNPIKISFRNDIGTTQKKQYTVNNISSFEISGFENYRRTVTWISLDHTELSQLTHSIDSIKIKDTVFLRTIYRGNAVSLYSYKDQLKERFFVAEKGSEPVELIYHRYLDPNPDHQSNILTQNGYKIQLYKLAIKYTPQFAPITGQIQRIDYTTHDLIKIVAEINGADNNSKNVYDNRAGVRFFAGVALSNQETGFNGDIAFNGERFSSFFPKVDVGLNLYLNKNVGDWIFKTDLSFTGNQAKAHTLTPEDGYSEDADLKFNQYIVSINPQLLYNFYNTKNIKIYLALGAAINYSTYSNKQYAVEDVYDGTTTDPVQRNFPDVQSLFFSLTTKVGLILNNQLDIYAGFNPSTSLNDDTGYSMGLSSYQVGINYLFGKK
jgi:hypothetical protein